MTKRYVWITLLLVLVVTLSGHGLRSQALPTPVLLVVNSASSNPYGPYLAEILKAEGISSFTVAQLSTVTPASLADTKLVVLAETALTDTQATTFSNFVAGGGRLVAMRPDSRLDSTLGITNLGTTTTDAYIQINASDPSGAGFTTTTLPFKGNAQDYALGGGASAVATLFSTQTTSSGRPAVVRSGRTATWAFDVARSVAYARQGDPVNAGVDRDGLPPLRTNDVFYNAIDKDRVSIPHADIQMRLLSRVIIDLLADATPLPTLWYYPNAARTVLVVTTDSHANPQNWFDDFFTAVNARNVKASLYLNGGSSPSNTSVQTWRSQGHEVGMHPAANQSGLTLDQAYQQNQNYFAFGGYGTPSTTTRNHQVEWLGWTNAATVAANHGIAMDTSFYTWGPAVTYTNGTQAHGYINGSGQMMRFVDQTGAIVPVWQLVTSLVDEQLIVGSFSENMTGSQALAVSQQLIDASQAGDYAAIMTQFHIDYYGWGDVQEWANGTMDYANALGIPNRTAEGLLRYTTDRAATGITGVSWQAGPRQLAFAVSVPFGGEAQTVTVPASYEGHALVDVRLNGVPVTLTTQTITGRSLAMFSVAPSVSGTSVVATYAGGTPAVSVSDVSVLEGTGGTATATFTLSLSPAASVPVTVSYATADGTATAPADYTAGTGSVTFNVGVTTRTVSVPVVTDSTFEPNEAFSLVLSAPVNATISDGTAIATILNDDAPPPGLSVGDVTVIEGQSGSNTTSVTVSLAPTSANPVTVNWATQNGTALAGSDYTAASGSLTFAPGTAALTIPLTIDGDALIEPDESFSVVLSGAVGSAIIDGTGVVTILNDDAVPTVGTFVRTTRDDFSCSVLSNVILTQAADGEVRLPGTFGDEFSNSSLGTQWTARTWAGGVYTPANTSGVLQIANANGAYVRSTSAVPVTSLDVRAEFTAAAWEHIGWAELDFAGPYLIFSTFNTTNTLFARSNTGGGEQTTSLGPIPAGTHTYHIDRISQGATDQIVYSIDGTVVATHAVNAAPVLLYVYQSHNGGTSPALNVDSIWVYPGYGTDAGAIDSCSLDAGSVVPWTTAAWTGQTPSGTALGIRTRTSLDGFTWSPWSSLTVSGQAIASPAGRYLQYGSDLTSNTAASSPVLESLTLGFGDDGIPTVAANNISVLEGQSGLTNAVFTVSLSGAAAQTVTVDFTTANGSATAGLDYLATSGTLTFNPGVVTQTVLVPVIGDTAIEPNETFALILSAAVNADLGAGGTGTILNDDAPPPSLSVSDVSVLEGNGGTTTAMLTVTLTPASAATVSVNWATQNGTAEAGLDYVAASGTATFAPGVTSVAVPVTVIGDTVVESDETVTMVLSAPNGGQIGDGSGTVTIVTDDAVPTAGTFVRTTRNDFSCGVTTNTILTRIGDGEVRLAGPFGDEFGGATLGSQWVAGTWAGGAYTPAISGGVLNMGHAEGAFLRSATPQTVNIFEAQAEFTGAAWQHVGWADLDFNGAFLIFSTFNTTDTLFVRSNTGVGQQVTSLGPIPTGVHTYRIERAGSETNGQFLFSIDGTVVATHAVAGLPATAALYAYLSHNGGVTPTLNVDAVQLYPNYVPSGTFDGCTLDAGTNVSWTNATWVAQQTASTTLTVRTRTSLNGTNWSAWTPLVASGQVVSSPAGRYLQYGFDLTSSDVTDSPVVESFTVGFSDPIPAATITIMSDDPDPSVVGQPVSVNYAVAGGSPTGSVTVSDGTVSCTTTATAGSCSLTFTSPGARTLIATYTDGGTNVSDSESHSVIGANTTTIITGDSPDPSVVGQPIAVTFTVAAAAPGAGTPTGNVTVSDGTVSCTASVSTGGCSITPTTSGAKTLTATYAGNVNFNSSVSAGASHTVNTSTGLRSPSANAAVRASAGDNNGFQTSPTSAYSNNNAFATDSNSGTNTSTSPTSTGKDKHVFYNYGFAVPNGSTITGIEVRLDAFADSTSGAPTMYVQLSWDGGVSWTTATLQPATLTTSEVVYTLGGSTDTWGRTWSAANFTNANFRVRIINVASSTARDFFLDYVGVNIHYR